MNTLCHPAGSQLWAHHWGTVHLSLWQQAEYLRQTCSPSIVLVKLWCRLQGIYWNMCVCVFLVKHCNLTFHGRTGIIDCEVNDSVLASLLLSIWVGGANDGTFSSVQGFMSSGLSGDIHFIWCASNKAHPSFSKKCGPGWWCICAWVIVSGHGSILN